MSRLTGSYGSPEPRTPTEDRRPEPKPDRSAKRYKATRDIVFSAVSKSKTGPKSLLLKTGEEAILVPLGNVKGRRQVMWPEQGRRFTITHGDFDALELVKS